MKQKMIRLAILVFVLWMMVIPAHAAMGGSYHPPAVTLITTNAPADLQITMELHKRDGTIIPTQLQKKTRGWEQQFRLYREAVYGIAQWYGNDYDLKDSRLILSSGGQERVIPLPQELTDLTDMNNVLILNYRTGKVTLGAPVWRMPLLAVIRVLGAVLVECLIFRLYGYMEKKTFLLVGGVSAVIHGLLFWYTAGWLNFDPRSIVAYLVFLILALFVQVLVFITFVEEYDKNRTFSATTSACLASVAVTTAVMVFLPL